MTSNQASSRVLLGAVIAVIGAAALTVAVLGTKEPTPLETPPPITAADGTVIPLPPNVAARATDAQRDAYADQVLASEHIDGQRENARAACVIMDSGTPPLASVAVLVWSMPPDVAGKVAYAGTLAYCPAHRAAFDNLQAMGHGGLRANPAQPSPAPIQVAPQLREPQASAPTTTTRRPPTVRPGATTTHRPTPAYLDPHQAENDPWVSGQVEWADCTASHTDAYCREHLNG